MKKKGKYNEIEDEYDFSQAEKGRYFARFQKGSNVVVLDPDVAVIFQNRQFLNECLRALAGIMKLHEKV
ncbi:MAG: hypothetical protein HY738_06245 [Bacteroidia bacterium]|nr:hypothetical protein [Bacteroidia bacterium]